MTEILSIYLFIIPAIPLAFVLAVASVVEMIGDCLKDDESEAPNVPDYDRQYFEKDTLKTKSLQSKEVSGMQNEDTGN